MMVVKSIRCIPYSIPFRQHWKSTTGAPMVREGWWLELQMNNGISGRAEIVCWEGFGEGLERAKNDIGHALVNLPGMDLSWPVTPAMEELLEKMGPEVRAGLEMGIIDAVGLQDDRTFARVISGPEEKLKTKLPRRIFVADPNMATREQIHGAAHIKVKALPSMTDTLPMLVSLRSLCGEEAIITVDANQGWNLQEWEASHHLFAGLKGVWIEEPCPNWWEGPLTHLSIVADESLHETSREAVLAREDLKALTIKPGLIGGYKEIEDLVSHSQKHNRAVIFSSSLGTSLERARTVHYACAFGGIFPVGLGPQLRDQAITESMTTGTTWIRVPRSPGLGLRTPGIGVGHTRVGPVREGQCDPDRLAWIEAKAEFTQAEWESEVGIRTGKLRELGVSPGHIVALASDVPRTFALHWEALRDIGCIVAPCAMSGDAEQLDRWCEATGANWHIVDETCTLLSNEEATPNSSDKVYRWGRSETRALVQTSGTTGVPGTQPLSHDQLLTSAFTSVLRLEHHHGDRWLLTLPLHRVGGLSILERRAIYGTAVAVPDALDGPSILEALRTFSCSHLSLVPTVLERLLTALEHEPVPESLRVLLVGGGPMNDAQRTLSRKAGLPVYSTWGMTEAASQICTGKLTDEKHSLEGSAGLPLSLLEVEHDGKQLIARGPQLGGSHATGDQGHIDNSGVVTVTGRADDIIITGGVNVAPETIENTIREHCDVFDAAAFGVIDPTWGEKVVALVRPRGTSKDTNHLEDELRGLCSTQMSPSHRPKEFHFVEIPLRNDMGKIPRNRLRAWFLEERRRGV